MEGRREAIALPQQPRAEFNDFNPAEIDDDLHKESRAQFTER